MPDTNGAVREPGGLTQTSVNGTKETQVLTQEVLIQHSRDGVPDKD